MIALNLIVDRLMPPTTTMIPAKGDGTAMAQGWHGFGTPDGTGQSQIDKALSWLEMYPGRQGLSLRKAAETAGVSAATMRRAIAQT
jgi:hypothetical protein